MIFLAGAMLIALSGYCLAYLLKLSRGHFIYDVALGWFLGGAYYCVSSALLVLGAGLPAKTVYSITIILLPIVVVLLRLKSYSPSIIASIRSIGKHEYLPEKRILSFESLLLLYTVFAYLLVFFHGASTPIISDDALSLRAYTPVLVYENQAYSMKTLILRNGIWPSFLTIFFWHLKGEIVHFYINYTVLVSLFCFLIIAYMAPLLKGRSRQGIYNVFLVMSLPLFIYQATTTYADVRMAMPYALGFLFFTFYVQNFDIKDMKTVILFFVITCLIKEKGVIAGLTGLTITLIAFTYTTVIHKRQSVKNLLLTTSVSMVLIALFFHKSNVSPWLWSILKNTHVLLYTSLIKEFLAPLLNSLIYGEVLNFSQYPFCIKFFGFLRSMFSSGNFGILFYLLFVTLFLNLRKIFKAKFLWGFLFWSILLFETFYYMVIIYADLDKHEDILHRTMIVFAVVSSIYLSSLWTKLRTECRHK